MADGTYWISFGHSVCTLAFMPVMLMMVRQKEWWANRAMGWKPVRVVGRMSYTLYVWHTFFYYVLLDLLGLDTVLGEKTRVPLLTGAAIVLSLPIYYGVERQVLKRKLRFASEKHVVDLNTGKMVEIDAAGRPADPSTEGAATSGADELAGGPGGNGSAPAGGAVTGGDSAVTGGDSRADP
jgi:peptidoglycan/LPS O-acetylase OafA/YrhL